VYLLGGCDVVSVHIAILISLIVLGIVLGIIGVSSEKERFNNGRCPECNNDFEFIGYDSQGGRGYCCRKCEHFTWVSYPSVDRAFRHKGV
jgi:hypothetical protein